MITATEMNNAAAWCLFLAAVVWFVDAAFIRPLFAVRAAEVTESNDV